MKTPSQLYTKGHAGNYALVRIKGDAKVTLTPDWKWKAIGIKNTQQL